MERMPGGAPSNPFEGMSDQEMRAKRDEMWADYGRQNFYQDLMSVSVPEDLYDVLSNGQTGVQGPPVKEGNPIRFYSASVYTVGEEYGKRNRKKPGTTEQMAHVGGLYKRLVDSLAEVDRAGGKGASLQEAVLTEGRWKDVTEADTKYPEDGAEIRPYEEFEKWIGTFLRKNGVDPEKPAHEQELEVHKLLEAMKEAKRAADRG